MSADMPPDAHPGRPAGRLPDIIDLRALDELRRSAGADFAAELARTFAEDVPGMLAALRTAQAGDNAVGFRRAAHSLRSNAITFGALPLAALAAALERTPPSAVDAEALTTLEAACRDAVAALQELCRE